VILTPFPRNAEAMGEVQLAPWHWLREKLLELCNSAAVVVDATQILGRQENGVFDGTYLPSMSVDQMHPNDDGHIALARAIANAVKSYL
jgi:lysophospholipase L1-like esterase